MEKFKAVVVTLVMVLLVGALTATASCVPPFWPKPPPGIRPIIFVHGGSGSAQQFESQAMRFTSNGYPPQYLRAFEYDSSFTIEDMTRVVERLDEMINTVLAETGADKVDLIGHSLGTRVSLAYLAGADRRAKVAHYINIDGSSGASAPEGVPTLGIWSRPERQIIGAVKNVWIPNQFHTEVCTSPESFAEMFNFLTGEEPATTDIIPEPPGQVWISGRVVIFPLNVFIEYPPGCPAILQIWEVDGNTGYRIYDEPNATFVIKAPDGKWGPFKAKAGVYYEFCLLREGLSPHHFYREPFIRSNYWITLLTSLPGGIADYVERSDQHSALLIIKNREFIGDLEANNDILEINGVNIITPTIFTSAKLVIGVWVYDNRSDGVSELTKIVYPFHRYIFQTAVDLFIPAADPPNGTISLVLIPRYGGGRTQVINVPNWASSKHRVTIQFNDYLQDINSFQEYMHTWRPARALELFSNPLFLFS